MSVSAFSPYENFKRFSSEDYAAYSSLPESNSEDFIAVVRLANKFGPIYKKDAKLHKIYELTDKKTAEAAAKVLAEKEKLPYNSKIQTCSRPLVTVLKQNESWFPVVVYSDVAFIIEANESDKKESFEFDTEEKAIKCIKKLAKFRQSLFVPELGKLLDESGLNFSTRPAVLEKPQ